MLGKEEGQEGGRWRGLLDRVRRVRWRKESWRAMACKGWETAGGHGGATSEGEGVCTYLGQRDKQGRVITRE